MMIAWRCPWVGRRPNRALMAFSSRLCGHQWEDPPNTVTLHSPSTLLSSQFPSLDPRSVTLVPHPRHQPSMSSRLTSNLLCLPEDTAELHCLPATVWWVPLGTGDWELRSMWLCPGPMSQNHLGMFGFAVSTTTCDLEARRLSRHCSACGVGEGPGAVASLLILAHPQVHLAGGAGVEARLPAPSFPPAPSPPASLEAEQASYTLGRRVLRLKIGNYCCSVAWNLSQTPLGSWLRQWSISPGTCPYNTHKHEGYFWQYSDSASSSAVMLLDSGASHLSYCKRSKPGSSSVCLQVCLPPLHPVPQIAPHVISIPGSGRSTGEGIGYPPQ